MLLPKLRTYALLARQLTLAYLEKSIFVNRNTAYLGEIVIIYTVCMRLSKFSTALLVSKSALSQPTFNGSQEKTICSIKTIKQFEG